jgi:hypothetical protein
MGVAAYNRGSAVISRRITDEEPSHLARLLADLTRHSEQNDGVVGFAPTVVRFGPAEGEVSIMNRQAGGWGARSYTYRSLWHLARRWGVAFVGGIERDAHGRFLRVVPLGAR